MTIIHDDFEAARAALAILLATLRDERTKGRFSLSTVGQAISDIQTMVDDLMVHENRLNDPISPPRKWEKP